MMRRATILAGLLAPIGAAPAHAGPLADIEERGCLYQWEIGGALHELPSADAARYAGGALHYCPDERGEVHDGRLLEAVRKDDAGLCYFGEWGVELAGTRANGIRIRTPLRAAYPGNFVRMQIGDGACPRQDDKGYIANDGVPDGLFLAVMRLWDAMLRSPEAFDDALAPGAGSHAKELRAYLSDPHAADLLHIVVVKAGNDYRVLGARDPGPAIPFEMLIDAGEKYLEVPIFVGLDWRDGVLKIVSVSEGKY